ncbi:MAG: selenocysteine-specific translation elongation factor [Denitratisoma sp.]|nr:selenocysteine-specific translation elongation factor [Denitratisoma sp.]
MIVGTAGHIDHGKTTLVKALTGVDCDRLKEEKARGITLDLGYAYADEGRLGFVDVPGHERLVHNMLAGATGIDFVLLVVAADDGPMPQTREHLAIADLLDLGRGAVALTKVDVVAPERRAAARAEIAALLAGTALDGAPVFEVSATQGEGVAALHDHLLAEAGRFAAHAAAGGFRHAIDRCFTLQGVGLVVTGTTFSGAVAVGDDVVVTPPGFKARVRGIHAQDRKAESGGAGERLALNLAGDFGKEDIARGMWIVDPSLHAPVARFHARLRVPASAEAPIRHWMPVHVHLGASDILGRVALLEGEQLASSEAMLAEILLEKPVGALWGDHFILRDQSATRTLGGGRVLDIFPPTRHKRAQERLDYLRLLDQADPRPALTHALARQLAGVNLDRYALSRNFAAEEAQALWRDMGLVVVDEAGGRNGFSPENWQALRQRLLDAARAEHARAPDMIGVERDRLRRLALPTLSRAAFDRLIFELLGSGDLAQSGSWLHLPEHRAALAVTDADLWRTLKPLLEAEPCNPPRVRDVARATGIAEETVRGLMKRVARVGQVYPVAHDHYFAAEAVADLAGRVARLCARDGTARAAALRDEIGGGRKVAIHILEFFDRVGYTRRVRDEHALRGESERQWII